MPDNPYACGICWHEEIEEYSGLTEIIEDQKVII
jgi:hypothetical protein